ncbi:MAG: TrkA family potassium uptake protein [Bdellovibrionaceae bacterium]|nr:TrkA family potassium uptake protein [Pseudobdellovibrionaceae bacterium]
MVKRILVIGLGRLGDSLARHLYDEGNEVIAIDTSAEHIDRIKSFTHLAVQGDASDMHTLVEVGAAKVDAAVICMGESFEASVLTLTNLLELKVPNITVRASNNRKAEVYKSVGAHSVFFVEEEMGRALAIRMSRPAVLHEMELDYNLKIVEWNPARWAQNRTIQNLNLPQTHQVQIIGLRDPKNPKEIIFPSPDLLLKEGFLALIIGSDRDVLRLLERS